MSLQRVYEIMTALESESGKLAKEQILEKNKGDEDFRFALHFLLNPFIVTGVSTKKISKEIEPYNLDTFGHNFDDLKGLLAYLRINNSGRDYNIYVLQNFINKQESEELKTFVKKLVTKDLKLGVSESTVNKVYGKNTIPNFKVMLAESFAKKEDKVKGKFFITLKLDGNRCVAIKDNGETKFFSRKGQEIEGLSQIEREMKVFPDGVYDGELILKNVENVASDVLFRATQKVVRKDGNKIGLEFHIFDSLPVSEFKDGKSKKTYEQRRNTLLLVFSKLSDNSVELVEDMDLEFVKLVPVLYEGTDKSVIPAYASAVEAQGYEGLMINTADGLYLNKRTDGLLKVKSMKTADLLVMSIEKAIDGQFKGLLGRVNVEYKGGFVGVGSGFTLEQRKEFADNPDLICGKIIEVAYFEESKNEKTGILSLRFPVFKGIREDKDVEDINYG